MVRILLQGCMGKMGQFITRMASAREDMEIVAGVDKFVPDSTPYPVYSTPAQVTEAADMAMDFTRPEGVDALLPYCLEKHLPLLLATTAISGERLERVQAAAKEIPIFMASNLSLGITLLRRLLPDAARTLEGYDVEIIERHHNQKVDAPSGTALSLAAAVKSAREGSFPVFGRHGGQAKRQPGEIGIHAIRGGTVAGDHEVGFYGHDEIVTFSHHAASREVFATGALAAAAFLVGKSAGFYDMDDLLKEMTGKPRAEATPHLGQLLFDRPVPRLLSALSGLSPVEADYSGDRLSLLLPMEDMAAAVTALWQAAPDRQPHMTPDITRICFQSSSLSPADAPRIAALLTETCPLSLTVTAGQLTLLVGDGAADRALSLLEAL